MTRWLAAARQAQGARTQLTQPTKPRPNEVSSVMSVLSDGLTGEAAGFGGGQTPPPAPQPVQMQTDQKAGHGASVSERHLTWTGRVVSLEDWSLLRDWERHGPNGRHWCGIARKWIEPKGVLDEK